MRFQKIVVSFLVGFLLSGCAFPPEEILNKVYSLGEIQSQVCSQKNQCADVGEELWFIDQGWVFKFNKISEEKTYTYGHDAVEILSYKGAVVALQKSKKVFVTVEGKKDWIEIGNGKIQIAKNNKDLFALSDDGELWAYQGQPGNLRVIFVPMTTVVPCGNGCMAPIITLVPMISGREMAFDKTKVQGVQRMIQKGNDVLIIKKTGQEFIF